MTLRDFQTAFKDLMLDHPDAVNAPADAISNTLRQDDIPLPEQLKVYRNNIVGTLTDVVMVSFPIMEKLVGKEFLEGMARSFVLKYPPEHGCLNTYGAGLDDFIRRFTPADGLPYLPDVARMEIALNHAYYAPDDTALTAQGLGSVPPDDLGEVRLNMRSSCTLINSPYPLLSIKEFCTSNAPDGTLDIDQGGIKLMIYRSDLRSITIPLTDDEFYFLTCLQSNTLGEALGNTMTKFSDFNVQDFLEKHLALETFQAINKS